METKHTRYNRSEKGKARSRKYEQTEAGKARKRAYRTEGLAGYLTSRRLQLRNRRAHVIDQLERLRGKDT